MIARYGSTELFCLSNYLNLGQWSNALGFIRGINEPWWWVPQRVITMRDNQGFKTWFEAVEWMEKEMDKEPYDIALIGCGAYGFPLAAHVKRQGKKAVYMGGSPATAFWNKGQPMGRPYVWRKRVGIARRFLYKDV